MSEIDAVVVPLDGSDVAQRALPVAHSIAHRAGASIVLVTSNAGGDGASKIELDEAAAHLGALVPSCVTVPDKSPADAVVDVTLAGDKRLLCMSTHGRGGFRRAALGSVADEVIRAGAVPLVLVGPSCDADTSLDAPGPVLLCIDGSARSSMVVDAGRRWAKLLDRDVEMVTVPNPFDGATPTELDDRFRDLSAPLAADGLRTSGSWIVNSSVPVGLNSEAERLKSPLIVIAPGSRSGWARLLIGSTTLALLADAPCPVLVVPEPIAAPRVVELD